MPDWLRGQLRIVGLIPAGLVAAGAIFGTPYFAGDYCCAVPPRFRESGCRVYSRCEYHGLQSARVLHGEQCEPFVQLLPVQW
jgi:hypothetical protein